MNLLPISFYLVSGILTFLLGSCTNNLEESPRIEVINSNYKQTLDSLVPNLMLDYIAPTVGVGIIKNGEIEFIKVYGEHQKGMNGPQNTIFNVASITKPVVAAAILKLVENGDWELDEPLFHYWTDPDVLDEDYAKLLTTRHCLSHTTGFKNWRWNEEGTYKTDRGFTITFHKSGNNLITGGKVFPIVKLYPSAQDEFFPLPFEVYFKFVEIDNRMTYQLLSSDRRIELTGEKI